ncbi:tetraacyldisaccharide 4'-kinase [Candidatus Pelagibacter sp.]|nr:tetraacyldisaccharide 4'-kinase [Candidatus Pelagibacter sp.]
MQFIKPKFWDLKKPNLLSYLLLPFTIPIRINNALLDLKSKKKDQRIKTICVGNIYVGGTGKTPTTIKLYQLLNQQGYEVLTANKNYKKHLDEKIILEKKTETISSRDRQEMIDKAISMKKKILIFDDGLQDKKVSYDIEFVCFDQKNWLGNGLLLPSGPLREKIKSLKKYSCVFLKKNGEDISNKIQLIKNINPNIKIFYTHFEPLNIDQFDKSEKYLIFSGIGNPNDFKSLLIKNKLNIIDEIIYPDHYMYNESDIIRIKKYANNLGAKIITTEKDYVKISHLDKEDINLLEVDLIIENEKELTDFIKEKFHE